MLLPPEALSFEFDAVGVVDEAIEDRVGDADDFVPAIDGQLAGDDNRAGFVSVLDDFEQITALVGVERFWSPVVQDQQIKSDDRQQYLGIAAIGAAECEGGEQTGRGDYVVPGSSRRRRVLERARGRARGWRGSRHPRRKRHDAAWRLELYFQTAFAGAAFSRVPGATPAIRRVRGCALRIGHRSLKPLAIPWRPRLCSRSRVRWVSMLDNPFNGSNRGRADWDVR